MTKFPMPRRFRFGRVSLPYFQHYSPAQLAIYEIMTAPHLKEGTIVGWSGEIEAYYGRRPEQYVSVISYDFQAGGCRSHFLSWDAYIMAGEPSSDLPLEGISAIFYGAVLVVDNSPAWRSLVEDGVTGWLCNNEREFIYKASRCAHEVAERHQMIERARECLLERFADNPYLKDLIRQDAGKWETNKLIKENALFSA